MHLRVNGVRLFFDVEGGKLVPDGSSMRERPTLILLHGGPGADHSIYKPGFSRFAEVCQVLYLDHRGNGRSERGPSDRWTLAQWGDDVHEFCRNLEIEKPIVLGESFGGYVAISYATRHPEHPGKLILISTAARGGRPYVDKSVALFERFGGSETADLARRHLVNPTRETTAEWVEKGLPHYNRRARRNPDVMKRAVTSRSVSLHFAQGELKTFDFRDDLTKIACPTLVIGGEDDPMTPIEAQAEIVASIRPDLIQFRRVLDAGHGPQLDDPSVYDVIRDFVLS